MKGLKSINWTLVIVLLIAGIISGVISQLLVVEGYNDKGEPAKKLAFLAKKDSTIIVEE